MNHRIRLAVGLGGLYGLLAVLFGILGLVLWADMQDAERQTMLAIMRPRYAMAVVIILLAWLGLGLLVWALYRAYALAPLRLREQALVMVNSNPALRLQELGASEIRTLAQVVNALADQRESLQRDVEQKILQAKASVEEEKNRLAALMSELTQSVVVCNLDGRILLYNNRARLQFQVLGSGAQAGGTALIGLGRSIFSMMERSLITHALESVQHRLKGGSAQPSANFVTTTRAGQLIRVQMAPVFSNTGGDQDASASTDATRTISGYVLMLDNITRHVEAQGRRDSLLQTLTEGSRASLGNVRAAVENLLQYPDMQNDERDRFVGVISDEVEAMSRRINHASTEFADTLEARWSLEDMHGSDLLQAAQRRIEHKLGLSATVEALAGDLWIRVDGFSLLQGLCYLAARLKDVFGVDAVALRLRPSGRLAELDLLWSGAALDAATLVIWEQAPMSAGGEETPLTLREVIQRHGGELWQQRDQETPLSLIRMLLPTTVAQESADPTVWLRNESRPEYYDFDLFRQTEETHALDDRLLTQLSYTVFDTETTGLEPSEGDEIIQIGATRIVNGRLLRHETIDQLIAPRRRLKPESIPIHGITDDMLKGQPTIDQVLPTFHEFCEDTVLVAHNAAFDMRFLQLKEAATGIVFSHPVLDTLLLSAVIHPNQESHRLEAIAGRLGVNVIGRHTALGDAIVTGEIFLKMIPLLAEQNIHTLGQARAAAARTLYARTSY
ncbi:MAG: exonuclease domain-containing protein [Rhodoferax sp.]|uniref:3'-5' exonuclease n=1 Tax=Rhodoferax sp. TaxID=50421 RepID=UPI002716A0EE|nr:exonuclease domain-containing protein [Rhodoferax sp.]MDO8448434.1 exonuclease domain-containing protein [Rhodoferax sp.]